MKKHLVVVGIIFLFFISAFTPLTMGDNIIIPNEKEQLSTTLIQSTQNNNHIWPMYKHDAQRTGRSPYDTSDNPGIEKWTYFYEWNSKSTAVIDKSGNFYVPSMVALHSAHSNGTHNWKQELIGYGGYEPAIDSNGTIYVGTEHRFHAFYPNGTMKWILNRDKNFLGYPIISPDDIIYVGTYDGYLYALYTNGSIKWEYFVDDIIRAPALDKEGNIYFTTYNDNYLYCIYPNGTFNWRFETDVGFRLGPVIGEDGTIFLAPATTYVQAVNSDGTEKWRTKLENGGASIPAIAPDGTIIISGQSEYVNALEPNDGRVLWTYKVPINTYDQTSAVIGADGTIFFAYNEFHMSHKGYLCALNSDGTFKWKTRLTSDIKPYDGMNILSDLSIGSDGTVYVPTWFFGSNGSLPSWGYIHAIGKLDSYAPESPTIDGITRGRIGEEYMYTFKSTSPVGRDLYYFVDWGDDSVERWIGPYSSGEEVFVNHTYDMSWIYKIKVRVKDVDNLWSDWSEKSVTIPRDKSTNDMLFRLLERFPLLEGLFYIPSNG
jgi:hypothetical protein